MLSAGELCIREVVICRREDDLIEVARLMRRHHVGCVIVVDPHGGTNRPIGMITDRDIVVGPLAAGHPDLGRVRAGDWMVLPLVAVHERDGLDDVLRKMRATGVRRIVVLDEGGGLAGLIAFDDLVEIVSEEMSDLVRLISREIKREEVRAPR